MSPDVAASVRAVLLYAFLSPPRGDLYSDRKSVRTWTPGGLWSGGSTCH